MKALKKRKKNTDLEEIKIRIIKKVVCSKMRKMKNKQIKVN